MPTAYATIIIPTLNRADTLPVAVASAQSQTVEEIEILVVLDGATSECRDTARGIASADRRVRVLDLPKAPGSGAANVHHALVTEARGPRIFYSDDDDLLMPHHVADLGPLLDHADVVESRVASVCSDGSVHLVPCSTSSPRMRELLGAQRYKAIYDTHFGHTLEAYHAHSSWIEPPEQGARDGVYGMLSRFAAAESCRWASCEQPTALSFHGTARRHSSGPERANELARWSSAMGTPGSLVSKLEGADVVYHLGRLLTVDPPAAGETIESYLALRGAYQDVCPRREVAPLFGMARGRPVDVATAARLVPTLSAPVEGAFAHHDTAELLTRSCGRWGGLRVAQVVARRPDCRCPGVLGTYSVMLSRFDVHLAMDVVEEALDLGMDPSGGLDRWRRSLEEKVRSAPRRGGRRRSALRLELRSGVGRLAEWVWRLGGRRSTESSVRGDS